jgi:cell division protein FtsL
MRLPVMLFLVLLAVDQQSQPPSPAPVKTANTDQKKSKPKQQQTSPDEEATKNLTTAILQLRAEIASRNQQQSRTPENNKAPTNGWTVLNAILTTVFTGILAVLAILQWRALHRQADIYDRQAKIADKQADIAAEQLAITKANEARREIEKTEEEDAKHIRAQIEDKKYLQQLDIANANAIAAKRSADAASSNAKALMNSERPWLVPKITRIVKEIENLRIKDEPRTFRSVTNFGFWIKNVGRTPAQIVAIRGDPALNYHGIDGGFTDPPDYGLPVVYKHVRLLAPGEKWRTDHDLNIWPLFHLDGTIEKDIKSHKVHYVFKAVILYHDTFDPNTVHETRFCYTYLETMDDWYPSGPPDHTKYT